MRAISGVRADTMPPSPEVMFLVGYKLNIANAPKVPTGRPSIAAPCACAASSKIARPCRSATALSRVMSAGCPYRCTGMMPWCAR